MSSYMYYTSQTYNVQSVKALITTQILHVSQTVRFFKSFILWHWLHHLLEEGLAEITSIHELALRGGGSSSIDYNIPHSRENTGTYYV